MRTRTRGWINE